MNYLRKFIKNNILMIILAHFGALAGYAYWFFAGCQSGCSITSVWYNSAVYGLVLGALAGNILSDMVRNKESK